MREKSFDFSLVAYTFRGGTFFDTYVAAQSLGEFRLISGTCDLQCTFFHSVLSYVG